MTSPAKHILFVMLNPGYVGHYASALRILIARGYRVTFAYQSDRNKDGVEQAYGRALLAELPDAVSIVSAPARAPGVWTDFVTVLRQWQDYLRYLRPEFRDAYALRERCARETPAVLRVLSRGLRMAGPWMPRALESMLRRVEALTPTNRAVAAFVARLAPDIVLVTPLVDSASSQVDFVRAAQELGVAAGHCVASWDNLTNKGSMRVVPDRVFVWNAAQQREATRLHGVPPGHVVITGAQLFDRWFSERPVHTREAFMARVGLPAERPFILYLGSSSFIAPQEATFVEQWLRAVRAAADPAVANAPILIRPHPNNALQYLGFDFTSFGDVVLWPPFGANMLDPSYKQDYFESLFYCAAAVGVNTSGMIEAGIVGKPVHTVLHPDFRHSQQGTLHFHHLTSEGGGLLHVAENLEDHQRQLAESLARGSEADPKSRAFVSAFVRPLGLDRPAAQVLADGIDSMTTLRRAASHSSAVVSLARVPLYPVAVTAHLGMAMGRHTAWAVIVRALIAMYVGWLWLSVGVPELCADAYREGRIDFRRWRHVTARRLRGWRVDTARRVVRQGVTVRQFVSREQRHLSKWMVVTRRDLARQQGRAMKRVRRDVRQVSRRVRHAGGRLAGGGRRALIRVVRYAPGPLLRIGPLRRLRERHRDRPGPVART